MARRPDVRPGVHQMHLRTATETMITNAIITAYCACALCCGRTNQPIASGAMPRQGITIAAPRAIPLGTVVYVDGVGRRVVQDRTAKRFDGRWDLFMTNHQDALKWGKQTRKITIDHERRN